MIPELFGLDSIGLHLHSFGLLMMLAFVAAWRRLDLSLRTAGEPADLAGNMIFWAGVGGVVGAKLWFLASFPELVFQDGFTAGIISSGFIFYGGLAGGAFGVWWLLRREKKDFLRFADLSAPALAVGYAVGRVGCQLSGDGCYGSVTTLLLSTSYRLGVVPTEPGVFVHPTPFYESLSALLLAFFLVDANRLAAFRGKGQLFGCYIVWSAISRFFVEFIRIEPIVGATATGMNFTQAQWFSLALIAAGAFLIAMPRPKIQ